MGKYRYLICVDGKVNSNKFYKMEEIGGYQFRVTYGREGVTSTEKIYDMSRWDSIYRNKTRKSNSRSTYTDVTDLRRVAVVDDSDSGSAMLDISISEIRLLMHKSQQFSKGSVSTNYKVSSEEVTPAMVEKAQEILDTLGGLLYTPSSMVSAYDVNDLLQQLYMTVPRKMKKVGDHLLSFGNDLNIDTAKSLFNLEQNNIDVMSQQVKTHTRAKVAVPNAGTILDSMGITISLATASEARRVKSTTQGDGNRIGTIYRVKNKHTQKNFDAGILDAAIHKGRERVRTYWHGSRNENWLPILDSGLLIRPPGASTTGAMFGKGIYFAPKFQKSLGYTSLRGSHWAGGSQDVGYMALFNVRIGIQYTIDRHKSSYYDLNARKLESLGYDSVWAKSGRDLYNDENIIYSPSQCTIAYLVQLR